MRPPSTGHRLACLAHAERGFSLIVALMMLIVIILLGISGSQMAINEERGARNDRDRQIAFQAAEAALKDAEDEILSGASPLCTDAASAAALQHGRLNSPICFNEASGVFFAANCSATPSFAQGLCAYNSAAPAYLSANVNFYGDASGSGGFGNTVKYGTFTNATYPSQATSGMSALAVSRYPPRYIIEIVPKNVAYYSCDDSKKKSDAGCKSMFRITAMGFGANANSQVVLQSIVSTEDLSP